MYERPKPLLILDIDETLVFADGKPCDRPCDFRVGPYHVYRRPGLAAFWSSCRASFDLAVWSSSGEDYLSAILTQIVPSDLSLQFAWSRQRCVRRFHPETREHYFVKDLKKVKRLGFDLARVLIADDTPQKVERQYGNAVYVRSFFGDPADDELPRLANYLTSIADCEDFRRLEKRGWRSQCSLQRHANGQDFLGNRI